MSEHIGITIYINIENYNGETVVRGQYSSYEEAFSASKNKVYWEHGSYSPMWYEIGKQIVVYTD